VDGVLASGPEWSSRKVFQRVNEYLWIIVRINRAQSSLCFAQMCAPLPPMSDNPLVQGSRRDTDPRSRCRNYMRGRKCPGTNRGFYTTVDRHVLHAVLYGHRARNARRRAAVSDTRAILYNTIIIIIITITVLLLLLLLLLEWIFRSP